MSAAFRRAGCHSRESPKTGSVPENERVLLLPYQEADTGCEPAARDGHRVRVRDGDAALKALGLLGRHADEGAFPP